MCGCVGGEGTGQVGMWERGGDRVGGVSLSPPVSSVGCDMCVQ